MAIANIASDYDAYSSTTVKVDSSPVLSGPTIGNRPAWIWTVSVLGTGSAVNDTIFEGDIIVEDIESTDQVNLNAYNSTGDSNPAADAASTFHSRCGGTTLVSVTTPYQAVADNIQTDLGTTADDQVEENIASPGTWAMGMTQTNFTTTEAITFRTDSGVLIIDYTAAAGGTTYPGWNQSRGGWW